MSDFYTIPSPLSVKLINSSEFCFNKSHLTSTMPGFESRRALKGILVLSLDHENKPFSWSLAGSHGEQRPVCRGYSAESVTC